MEIYKVTNKLSGMSYIGQTIHTMGKRRKDHERCGENTYLQNAIKLHGKDAFEWDVLCECSDIKELNEKEMFYIKEYDTLRPNGYNLTNGGEGSFWTGENNPLRIQEIKDKVRSKLVGRKYPELARKTRERLLGKTRVELYGEDKAREITEAKRKMMLENNPMNNPEYRKKVGDAKRGQKCERFSEMNKSREGKSLESIHGVEKAAEMREKMSLSHKGIKFRPKTEEEKQKMREVRAKYIWTITTPNGDVYVTISMKDFCKTHGVIRETLMRAFEGCKSLWKVTRVDIVK